MIRVKLIDHSPSSNYVDFRVVPVSGPADYCCRPEGLLAMKEAIVLSQQLHDGDVEGYVGHYRWHRQALSGDACQQPEPSA